MKYLFLLLLFSCGEYVPPPTLPEPEQCGEITRTIEITYNWPYDPEDGFDFYSDAEFIAHEPDGTKRKTRMKISLDICTCHEFFISGGYSVTPMFKWGKCL